VLHASSDGSGEICESAKHIRAPQEKKPEMDVDLHVEVNIKKSKLTAYWNTRFIEHINI
jgi:hypothetical protein